MNPYFSGLLLLRSYRAGRDLLIRFVVGYLLIFALLSNDSGLTFAGLTVILFEVCSVRISAKVGYWFGVIFSSVMSETGR